MQWISWTRGVSFSLLALAALALAGCGGSQPNGPPAAEPVSVGAVDWCAEHGVPEGLCARCNAKVAAEFKRTGDWCKEHNRPESQCFVCNPKLQAKFAAEYEARYGKKPPAPTE